MGGFLEWGKYMRRIYIYIPLFNFQELVPKPDRDPGPGPFHPQRYHHHHVEQQAPGKLY